MPTKKFERFETLCKAYTNYVSDKKTYRDDCDLAANLISQKLSTYLGASKKAIMIADEVELVENGFYHYRMRLILKHQTEKELKYNIEIDLFIARNKGHFVIHLSSTGRSFLVHKKYVCNEVGGVEQRNDIEELCEVIFLRIMRYFETPIEDILNKNTLDRIKFNI